MTISETICFHRFYFGMYADGYLVLNSGAALRPAALTRQETTR